MSGLQFLFLMEGADASGKGAAKAAIAAPSVKPFPDRGMTNLPPSRFCIDHDRNVLPLAARVQLVQDVVKDAVERHFQLPAAFGQGKERKEKLVELFFCKLGW